MLNPIDYYLKCNADPSRLNHFYFISAHIPLVATIVYKSYGTQYTKDQQQDMVSDIYYHLLKSNIIDYSRTYLEVKGYMASAINNYIIKNYRYTKRYCRNIPITDLSDDQWLHISASIIDTLADKRLDQVQELKYKANDIQTKYINDYLEGYNITEIATRHNVTKQYVHQVLRQLGKKHKGNK